MPYFILLALLAFQESPTFQVDVKLVHVDAEVRHNQRLIERLTKDDFRIIDSGTLRPVVHLARDGFGRVNTPSRSRKYSRMLF
jgi:hypothetical protein